MEGVKALTLHQPWASLVALGHKTIETRSWATKHRGPIAIHAAASVPTWVRPLSIGGFEIDRDNPPGTDPAYLLRGPIAWPYRLPLGSVVATANLRDCITIGRCHDPYAPEVPDLALAVAWPGDRAWHVVGDTAADVTDQLPFGDYSPGRWAWMLDDIKPCDPVPARGRQGLWEWTP